MISYTEALAILHAAARPLPVRGFSPGTRADPAAKALVAAADVLARHPVPGFDNAAMDGFAVRAADSAQAAAAHPCRLSVSASLAAGQAASAALAEGSAIEIMTGAPLPPGSDAIVPVERATLELDGPEEQLRAIRLSTPVSTGANIRRQGEDFQPGMALIKAGELLDPARIMALAANGISELAVRRPPAVAILTTGSELGDARQPAQIHDANGPYLQAFLQQLGIAVTASETVADEPAAIAAALKRLASLADVVISTGGVSAGRLDGVPAAIRSLGAEILFHKVAIRPGKPLLMARLDTGPLIFGLPGNPVAVAVGLRFFVLPALRALQGRPAERYARALTTAPLRPRTGLRFFGKAHASLDADCRLTVSLLPGQESFKISPLLNANCWLIVPEGEAEIPAGSMLEIAPAYPCGGEFMRAYSLPP